MENIVLTPGVGTFNTEKFIYAGNTALWKGQPVCFNLDYGTATTEDMQRVQRVELPSSTNSHRFAGTCMKDYAAFNGDLVIEVAKPGGLMWAMQAVATSAASTITPGTRMTFEFTSGYGYFGHEGFMGRGTVEALHTKAVSTSGPLCFSSFDGTGAYSHATLTITDTGCGSTAGTAAGDTVVVFGGSRTTATGTLTPGEYTVASVAAGTITLTTSPVSTGNDWFLAYAVVKKSAGRPVVLCKSFDGEESGGVEYLGCTNNTAVVPTVNGVSYVCGGATFATGPATYTQVSGTNLGQRKGFGVLGLLTTHGLTITASNVIFYPNSVTTATSFEIEKDGEFFAYKYGRAYWTVTDMSRYITIA